MAEEDRLAAAVRAKQQAVAAVAQGAEGLASQLRVLLAEQQRLAAIPKVAGASSSNASGAGLLAWQQEQQHELASLQGRLQQHRAGLQLLQRQEQRLQLEAGTLAARLGSSTPGGGAAASVAWRPLHRCFALKDPQQSRAQAQALQVLGGGKLGVVVADSMEAAGKLLAAGVGARIWPLDSLSAADHQAQHARAAQHFAQGHVLLPLDLMQFHASHRPALLRAFGSHVIAATDAVAAELVTRFGISSVTLDGKLTSQGTLQGGWRGGGSASGGRSLMHFKLSLDSAEQQLAALQQQIAAAQVAADATALALLQMQRGMDAAGAAAAELAAAEQDLKSCRQQLSVQQATQHDGQAQLDRLKAEVAVKRHMLLSLQAESSSGAGGGMAAKAALQAELVRLAAAAAALGAHEGAVAAELAAAEAEAAALDAELAMFPEVCWEEEVGSRQRDLNTATAAMLSRQAELALQSARVAAKQQEVEQASAEAGAADHAAASAAADEVRHRAAAERVQSEQRELQLQLDVLLRDVPELEAVLHATPGNSSGAGCFDADGGVGGAADRLAALKESCLQLAKRRSLLLKERRGSAAALIPLAEQIIFREQQAALAAAGRQAETLRVATQRLQEGMAASDGQVLAANEAVFTAIGATFSSLATALLPAYQLRLRKVGAEVHEGVRLEFCHKDNNNAASGCGDWQSGLDALSGGQRTMVCLTVVVAAAMAGGGTSVMLMDEVDAALDETNQHLVARLLDTLMSSQHNNKGGGGGNQVLCVSHNHAFQQLCCHVVQLTKGPSGTRLADGARAPATRALAAGKIAAGGHSKKARTAALL